MPKTAPKRPTPPRDARGRFVKRDATQPHLASLAIPPVPRPTVRPVRAPLSQRIVRAIVGWFDPNVGGFRGRGVLA